MILFFQNILFSKEFVACNGCFGLITKMKKQSGTSFWCPFPAWFFHKNILYLILYQWTRFQCHNFFPSQDLKQNVLLSSYLNFKIYPETTSNAKANREKKRGRNTNIFHSFWRAIIWLKIKIWSKIADTSFKKVQLVLWFVILTLCTYHLCFSFVFSWFFL